MQMSFVARSLPFALAILLLFLLSGCASLTGIGATEASNAACALWKPVSWSKKDTDQTITEVKINNARREAWCHDAK